MPVHYVDHAVTLHHGDALDILPTLPDASVDAVVTDPPYGLEFMGKEWDAPWKHGFGKTGYVDGAERVPRPNYGSTRNPMCRACRKHQREKDRCACQSPDFDETPADSSRLYGMWCQAWAAQCLRVLKPGGHLIAFGGTRTVHRLTASIEDAGFEIRDGIDWLYGQGFPKSLDVSKAIGKATPAAARWSGWGTALKPAREPIVVARKPLAGTVAATVMTYGTGALNIDACRVGAQGRPAREVAPMRADATYAGTSLVGRVNGSLQTSRAVGVTNEGRWPPNVVFSHAATDDGGDACADGCVDGCPVAELDEQTGTLKSGANPTRRGSDKFRDAYGEYRGQEECTAARRADAGGASRFFPVFRYQAKASAAERPRDGQVAHPTVKPLDLMRWLARLVTPPGGKVLDLFGGSGTTAEACLLEGFDCIIIEREADYLPLIVARLSRPIQAALLPDDA
jgi:DNA modification methylase